MSQMTAAGLASRLTAAPHVGQGRAGLAKVALARFNELLADPRAAGIAQMTDAAPVRALLLGIAAHSPFLWRLIKAEPPRLLHLLDNVPEAQLAQVLARLGEACASQTDVASLMRLLRKAKQETALLIALADLGGVWSVVEVTRALSQAADCFVALALRFALGDSRLLLPDPAHPETGCGLVVLALGKHGALELNYSSDVDLVVFFDPACAAVPAEADPAPIYVRITKTLARLLQERTGDGYVLRVDLRLRPDPGSTAIAIALPAAFHYYETLGQNWERAALIKARPVAGDLELGRQFLADLAPFIWRKFFDYAAIADIHAMKRQIHAVRGHAEVTVAGHDVKLGRGGIREIEFFVQTQQLIFGGRRVHLRGARTLDMLVALQQDGWVTEGAVADLTAAYLYLRGIEHRLQMLADEQTQRLPGDAAALKQFAQFCGTATLRAFSIELTRHLLRVEAHYALLFEHAPGLDTQAGSLVFTGTADDPDTLATLRKLGFRDAALAAETVRGWHFGRRAAVQSPRAREVLTELVPGLLEAFAGSGDPDAALANFDAALARMPAAIELFSLLKSNATLRELFGDILGGAPRLASIIAQRPHVLDAAIDPAIADAAALEARVAMTLQRAQSTEDFLDALRDLAQDEMFAIGVRLLSGRVDPGDAALAYTALAEVFLRAALAHVESAFAREHGLVPSGRCMVLGMGKLGSREMTAASDLDLILIFDFDPENPESDGARKLHAVTFYARLTQRLVSALTVATRRGKLYDVDLRLRPSGGKGPLATQARGFIAYQTSEAETWEHMALTRARFVAGDAVFGGVIERAIRAILARPFPEADLRRDVVAMRRLIAAEKGEADGGDLKLAAGGLLDIEFIAQYLVLRHARNSPEIMAQATAAVLAIALRNGLIAPDSGQDLLDAHRLYSNVTQMQRLLLESGADPNKAGEGVKRRIAAAGDLPDFRRLARELNETRAKVRAIFTSLLSPDDVLPARPEEGT